MIQQTMHELDGANSYLNFLIICFFYQNENWFFQSDNKNRKSSQNFSMFARYLQDKKAKAGLHGSKAGQAEAEKSAAAASLKVIIL